MTDALFTPLHNKILHVERMIKALEQRVTILGAVGRTTLPREQELAFQRERLQWLEWAGTVEKKDIEKRIKDLEKSTNNLAKKYKDMNNVPVDEIKIISFIEDMEIALETHPAVKESKEKSNKFILKEK